MRFWRGFFLLASLQSLLALSMILRGSSETSSRLFGGLSLARLGLSAAVLTVLVIFAGLLAASWIKPAWTRGQIERVQRLRENRRALGRLALLSGGGLLLGGYAVSLTPELSEPFTAAIFERFLPITILVTGLCAQSLAALLVIGAPANVKEQLKEQWIFWLGMLVISLCFIGWGWVVRQTIHTESAITGWNDLGTPLLETQVFLAWLIGMAAWGAMAIVQGRGEAAGTSRKLNPLITDVVICLAIWLGTVLLWNSTPAPPSYFLTAPRLPNNELYPNSDALVYDMSAQVLLNGGGLRFANDIYVRRPMLALFFAGLHGLGGQQAGRVYFWQIFFLAAAPAVMYLLGKSLHSRLAGVIAAALLTLRGANAILLSNAITTSHVKELMADLPTALAMLIFVFTAVRWLQTRSQTTAMAAGGMLGVAILIRPETGAAILACGLIAFLAFRKELRNWLLSMALFGFGLLLVVAPWVYRNWSMTGLIFLDTPSMRTDWLQERYNITPQASPTPQPDGAVLPGADSQADQGVQAVSWMYQSPVPVSLTLDGSQKTFQGGPGDGLAAQIATKTPAEATPTPVPDRPDFGGMMRALQQGSTSLPRSFISHYLNSQIQIFLTLPTTLRPLDSLVGYAGHHSLEKLWYECCSSLNYYRRLPYWRKWGGEIPTQAAVMLVVNLALIAFGVQQGWRQTQKIGDEGGRLHDGWIALLPLSVGAAHLAINAVARNSGGRYILPIDWFGLLYYCFGLATASVWAVNLFARKKLAVELIPAGSQKTGQGETKKFYQRTQFWLAALGLLLLGSAAPVFEAVIPARYPDPVRTKMLASLFSSPGLDAGQRKALSELLENKGIAVAGRALYPRHFGAREAGEISEDPLEAQTSAHLGFYLVGNSYLAVLLPMEQAPSRFPNGADALFIGCPDGDAAVVALFPSPTEPARAVWVRSPSAPPLSCLDP